MDEMDRAVHGQERQAGGESHHHCCPGWWWCWPASHAWCGAFIIAIGAGMILSDLEAFRGSEATVWGLVLAGFGIFTVVHGLRRDSVRGPGR